MWWSELWTHKYHRNAHDTAGMLHMVHMVSCYMPTVLQNHVDTDCRFCAFPPNLND